VQPPLEFLQTAPLFEGATATLNEADSIAAPAGPAAVGRQE
jgi:hypothetical protein